MKSNFDEKEEQEFLESRIQDINRTIQEDPKQEKYLSYDLGCFEEDLHLLCQQKSLRTANRKIKKFLQVDNLRHLKSSIGKGREA